MDILERGGGRAIDELVVDLPDASLQGLLASEISQVDGVDVEEIRPVADALHDPRLDALETAALLVGPSGRAEIVGTVLLPASRVVGAPWTAAIGTASCRVRVCAYVYFPCVPVSLYKQTV